MGEFDLGTTDRQARMFASFDYLREILDSCAYAAVVLNEQRRIVFFNRALLTLTGRLDSVIGMRWGDALHCDRALLSEGCGTNEACQTCGAFLAVTDALGGFYGARDCRFTRTVNDRTEWLDLSVSVSPAFIGEERFLVCSVRDISNEKRKAALERIFFHDVLNSATGVELLAHLLQSMSDGDASLLARQISACASQLVDEIESQQQLVAAEKEELAVKPVTLNTRAFILSAVERHRVHPMAEGRRVEIDSAAADVAISTDDSILRRVVDNMTRNALEASKPGETIRIGCRDLEHEVEFRVHNPGVMPEPVQLQVFQRSFSTKGSGRGLGTYSMKLLSERYLRGSVSFHSAAGEGTFFIARYPKHLDPSPPRRTGSA
ncbi:MAG: histidine kinase [Proteobacteria bacterium]|nr:MAG: histidine kinase [Pseudomonadota bacterium]